jgi:hypothetical protein
MSEHFSIPENRPVDISRQSFIDALKGAPAPSELDDRQLPDLIVMYENFVDDIKVLLDAAMSEVEKRTSKREEVSDEPRASTRD